MSLHKLDKKQIERAIEFYSGFNFSGTEMISPIDVISYIIDIKGGRTKYPLVY